MPALVEQKKNASENNAVYSNKKMRQSLWRELQENADIISYLRDGSARK